MVLGHTNPPFSKYIYGFHMPLFFILSGLIWHEQSVKDTLKKNFRRYIIPYFILCFSNLALWILLCSITGSEHYSVAHYIFGIFYSRGTMEWMPNCSPLWYLTAQFLTILIIALIWKMKSNKTKTVVVALCLFCGLSLDWLQMVKLPWDVDTALVAVFFVYAGINLKEYLARFKSIWIPLSIIVGFIAVYMNPIEAVSFDNNKYGNPLLMIIGALCLSEAVIILANFLAQFDNLIVNGIHWFGRHTVFIMGYDYFVGGLTSTLLWKVGAYNFLTLFILKILLLSIGCVIWNKAVCRLPVSWQVYLKY